MSSMLEALLNHQKFSASPLVVTAAANPDEEKWEHFTDPNRIITKVGEAYAVLGSILAHPAFSEAGGRRRSFSMDRQANIGNMFELARRKFELQPRVKDLGAKGIEMVAKLPNLRCDVKGALTQPTADQAALFETGRKLLKALFPSVDLDNIPLANGRASMELPSASLPVERLAAIKIPNIEPISMADWGPTLRGVIAFKLQPIDLHLTGGDDAPKLSPHSNFEFTVEVEVVITLPREYALWSTSSTEENYAPLLSFMQFKRRIEFCCDEDPKGKQAPPQIDHPDKMDKISKAAAAKYGLGPKPQVDADDITVTIEGELMWVPPAGVIDISAILKSCVDDEGKIDIAGITNRHIGTDWTINKFVITDATGKFKLIDLTGCRKPTQISWSHLMSLKPGNMLNSMLRMCNELGVVVPHVEKLDDPELTWENLIDVPLWVDENKVAASAKFFEIGKAFKAAYTLLISSKLPVFRQYEIRPFFVMFGIHAEHRMEYAKAFSAHSALHRANVPDTPPIIHNMTGMPSAMPHQVRVFNTLAQNPLNARLAIRAGGGKTPAIIYDVTDLMFKGLIKRPEVIMPRNLLPQFATEVQRFTQGHIRTFLISGKVWNKFLMKRSRSLPSLSHPLAFLSLLKRQPKNTMFLVDYNWLTLRGEDIEFMGDSSRFFPHAAMLAQMDFDYVAADESQRAKNMDSSRSRATSTQFANATYRRISSGTIVGNTVASDLAGQMSLLEPTALNGFNMETIEGGEGMRQSAALNTTLDRFSRPIDVQRREWAHLIPEVIERVHDVELTPRQLEFHNKYMTNLFKELRNDKKISDLMKKDSAEAQRALAALLKRRTSAIEIWLNAPDSTRNKNTLGHAFMQMTNVQPLDLVSVKVAKIDELLEQHFKGGVNVLVGKDQEGNDVRQDLPPDPNKVIVFCYNKAVTAHIFQHSKFSNQGIYYTAGDDRALDRFKSDDEDSPKILYADENCFPGYMNVLVDYDRAIPIADVYADPSITHVLAYDLEKKKIIKRKLKDRLRFKNKDNDRWLEITVKDGEREKTLSFEVTDNHAIFLNDGSEVQAKDLRVGDNLITYGGEFNWWAKHPQSGEIIQKGNEWMRHTASTMHSKCPVCGFSGHTTKVNFHRMNAHGHFPEWKERLSELRSINAKEMWKDPKHAEKVLPALLAAALDPENIKNRIKATKLAAKNSIQKRAFWAKPKEARDIQTNRFINAPYYTGRGPNKVEQRIIDANIPNLKFVGDGSYFVELEIDGILRNKNPDFIYAPEKCGTCKNFNACKDAGAKIRVNTNACEDYALSRTYRTNKVVEVMDLQYWHDKSEIAPLNRAYAKHGIKCLVIDAAKKIDQVRGKIESHINNHYIEVTRIREIHKKEKLGDYKYDLTVEGNHNYFVVAGSSRDYKCGGIPVLVHNSMQEGHNLQISSRIIRVQILWTPGAQEQAHSRVIRPDVPNKDGIVKYPRDRIWLDWIVVAPSIEVAKVARLVGKQIENTLFEEGNDPELKAIYTRNQRHFDRVTRIKISFEFLETHMSRESLISQFYPYSLIKEWEAGKYLEAKNKMIAQIKERTGLKVIPRNQLAKLSMIGVHSDETPEFDPGKALQSQGYTPWVEGFTGYNPTNLHLLPLSMPDPEDEESGDEDDSGDDETVNAIAGDPVLTEFGPGIVTRITLRSKTVIIMVPGFSDDVVSCRRAEVLGSNDPVTKAALRAMIQQAGKAGLPTLRRNDDNGDLNPVVSRVPPEHIDNILKVMEKLHAAGKLPTDQEPMKNTRKPVLDALIKTTMPFKAIAPVAPTRKGLQKPVTPLPPEIDDNERLGEQVRKGGKPPLAPKVIPSSPIGLRSPQKAPGLSPRDPYVNPKTSVPQQQRGLKPPPKQAPIMLDKVNKEDLVDHREGEAAVLNGVLCIISNAGTDSDEDLLRNGFSYTGKSMRIRVLNPKGMAVLVDYLSRKFFIPPRVKKELDRFISIYQTQKANIAYLKNSEQTWHTAWLRDQRKMAVEKTEIRPYPVVEYSGGVQAVYLYINYALCPAALKLKGVTVPGCKAPQPIKPTLLGMVKNTAEAKALLKHLKEFNIVFDDESQILSSLRKIRA